MVFGGGGSQNQRQEVSNTAIVGAVAVILIVFGSVVGLTIAGRPVDAILYIVPILVAPTLLAFLAVKKADRNGDILRDVQVKVNGRQDALHSTVAVLEHQLRQNGIVPATDPTHEGKHSDG